jgi:hypothetical protein
MRDPHDGFGCHRNNINHGIRRKQDSTPDSFPIVNQENAGEKLFLNSDENVGKINTVKYQLNN